MTNKSGVMYPAQFSKPIERDLASPEKFITNVEEMDYSSIDGSMSEEDVACSTPLKARIRRSRSLMDISLIEMTPNGPRPALSSDTILSYSSKSKDSGYVRSGSSLSNCSLNRSVERVGSKVKSYIKGLKQQEADRKENLKLESSQSLKIFVEREEEEEKSLYTRLREELAFKDVLISALQESNGSLRLKYAEAENKISELRVKCEQHCNCCLMRASTVGSSSVGFGRQSFQETGWTSRVENSTVETNEKHSLGISNDNALLKVRQWQDSLPLKKLGADKKPPETPPTSESPQPIKPVIVQPTSEDSSGLATRSKKSRSNAWPSSERPVNRLSSPPGSANFTLVTLKEKKSALNSSDKNNTNLFMNSPSAINYEYKKLQERKSKINTSIEQTVDRKLDEFHEKRTSFSGSRRLNEAAPSPLHLVYPESRHLLGRRYSRYEPMTKYFDGTDYEGSGNLYDCLAKVDEYATQLKKGLSKIPDDLERIRALSDKCKY